MIIYDDDGIGHNVVPMKVIEDIKQEIRKLSNANPSYWHTCDVIEREDVLDIIDKYTKGEE